MASKTKVAMSSPIDRLAALTGERDRLREQADLVRAAPRSLDEARADIPRTIELLAARVDLPVGYLAGGPSGFADLAHVMGANLPDWPQLSPMAAIAWCAPQQLAAALERDLVRAYEAMPVPLDSATKVTELARLRTEIGRLETELVAVWWGAIDGGMTLPVPDVRGDVLIGLPSQ